MADFDVVVLGAGPGGYVAAIRASQLGKKVAVVEKKYWGGVCLNVGCIPSKALIKNAELAHVLTHDKKKYGIEGDATMSYGPTHQRSRQVSDGIVRGVHFLMKKNKIEEIDGWGTLTGPSSMDVALNDGSSRQLTFDHLIIATGATTRMLPGVTVSQNVVTYEEQILDPNLPGSMIIAGSGAIGVEFAYVMKNIPARPAFMKPMGSHMLMLADSRLKRSSSSETTLPSCTSILPRELPRSSNRFSRAGGSGRAEGPFRESTMSSTSPRLIRLPDRSYQTAGSFG